MRLVLMCIYMQTFHDTYQYYYMIAPVVLVCIGTCIWYVFVGIFDHFYKYTLIHTFTTGDLRAGSCVRTSRPKVPLGLLMYVSHGRQHQRMALGAFACSGRQPTGTFMLRGPATYWAGTFRAAARCDAALGGSDSAAVKPATLRACRKLRWPCRARGGSWGDGGGG